MIYRKDSLRPACKDFEQDLVLYHYGECAETERRRVEAHLNGCASCRNFLEDLRKLLPLTVKPDEPPQAFWESYSRELRRKLSAVEQNDSWWKNMASLFHPWPLPALATALVLILAITLTFTKGWWGSRQVQPQDETLLEVLPIVENLEFLESVEMLDALEKTEGRRTQDRAIEGKTKRV